MVVKQTLRVVTFNVSGLAYPPHLKFRMRAIAEYFNQSDADILLFQEVHTYPLLRFLKNNLPSFDHGTYMRSVFGPKGGLVIFSRVALHSVRFTGVTNGTKKGMLITKAGDTTLVNLHLSANKDGDWTPGNHYYTKQSIQLNDVARQLAQIGGPLIVGGDFNVARDSELYDMFVDRTHLQDTAGQDHRPSFHMPFLPVDRDSHCIDFIFTRNLRTLDYDHLFDRQVMLANGVSAFVSSHHAIVTEVSLGS